jgi:AcrR family transcriptional regulator
MVKASESIDEAPAPRAVHGSRSAKWHQRRIEVIDTSAAVFARSGYHGVGLIELCEANQLSKGALYYYIGSKEQLLEAINDRLLDEIMLGADRVERSSGSPPEKLAMLGTEFMNVMVRLPHHASVMMHDYPALTGEYAKRFKKRRREYELRVERIIEEGIESGDFREVDPYNAAQAWLGTQTHMWRMAQSSRSAHGYSSTVEDIFVRGIRRERSGDAASA